MAIQSFNQMFFAADQVRLSSERPLIKKYLDAATAVWSAMPEPVPLWWYRQLFRLESPEYYWLLEKSRDRDAVQVFRDLERRAGRSPIQYEAEAGGAARRAEMLKSVALWGRCGGGSLDWTEIGQKRMHVGYDLSGLPTEMARLFIISNYTAIQRAQRRHFAETGEAVVVLLIIEELGVTKAVTPLLLDWMREGRELGGAVWGVTQCPTDLGDKDTFAVFVEMCWRVGIHRLTTDLGLIRPLASKSTFDPMAVHYTRSRRVPLGPRPVETTSTTKTTDGKKSLHEGIAFVNEYADECEHVFKGIPIQDAEWDKTIATLRVGQMVDIGPDGVRIVDVPHPGEPWPLGGTFLPSVGMTLTEKRTQEAVARARSTPYHQVPTWQPTPPRPVAPQNPAPPRPRPPKGRQAARRLGGGGSGRS